MRQNRIFCTHCGRQLDKATGLCPKCDSQNEVSNVDKAGAHTPADRIKMPTPFHSAAKSKAHAPLDPTDSFKPHTPPNFADHFKAPTSPNTVVSPRKHAVKEPADRPVTYQAQDPVENAGTRPAGGDGIRFTSGFADEDGIHFTFGTADPPKPYSKALKTVDIILLVIALVAGSISVIGNYILYSKPETETVRMAETVPTEERTAAEESAPATEGQAAAEDTAPATENTTEAGEPKLIENPVSQATASSTYHRDTKSHNVRNLLDDDPNTNWCEGASGFGEGEYILFEFKDTYLLCSVRIRGGNRASEMLFYANGRPKDVTLTYSDGTSESFRLEDQMKSQLLAMSTPVETSSLKITIDSVYEGTYQGADQDTVISDVILEAYG